VFPDQDEVYRSVARPTGQPRSLSAAFEQRCCGKADQQRRGQRLVLSPSGRETCRPVKTEETGMFMVTLPCHPQKKVVRPPRSATRPSMSVRAVR